MLLHLKFKKGLRPLGFQMRLKTFSVRRLFRWGVGRLLERCGGWSALAHQRQITSPYGVNFTLP